MLLYYGAGWLVNGSSTLARSLGITPLVIGLTVVAFGTSAPELFVSAVSALKGKSMIAIGNVVGSNICNIGLVLGAAALVQPITCERSLVTRDIPVMLLISVYLLIISLDSKIGRIEGVTLVAGIIAYTFFNYYFTKKIINGDIDPKLKLPDNNRTDDKRLLPSRSKQITLIIIGITGVVVGAELLIDSAVKIMTIFKVNEKFIGLTIIAFGTSVPELATSFVSALKKEMDISIGNLVGSNVFNILSVIGVTSLIKPVLIPEGIVGSGLLVDYIVMLIISFLPWVMLGSDCTISRKEGFILLSSYLGYIIYLSI